MNNVQMIITILTVLGALSPLLTFATLFQQTEWRFDRLREHLRHHGILNQLFGKIRPVLALCLLLTDLFGLFALFNIIRSQGEMAGLRPFIFLIHAHEFWLALFILLGAVQLAMGKHRFPVWTTKAVLIVTLSILMTTITSFIVTPVLILTPFILILQPFVVFCVWLILLPLDRFMKQRTFKKAETIRNQLTDVTVIGIAGSVGKTTTKELLRCVLQDLSPVVTPEHINTEMGIANWLLQKSDSLLTTNHSLLIVEMGAYRIGEIALTCSFIKPTIAVMTAIGSDHLALFGSEESIVEANSELLRSLPENGHAFLYGDNETTRNLQSRCHCSAVTIGTHEECSLRSDFVEETENGLRIGFKGEVYDIHLHGIHNVGNVILAIAVAQHFGISNDRIREELLSFESLTHTFHVHHEHNVLLVDDTYNSSRLSIRAALHWASKRSERPRVLLLSDLLETGKKEDEFLEELGKAASSSVERVVMTSGKNVNAFERGFGKKVEILNDGTEPVSPKSLLLCLGRMPQSAIKKLLPLS